MRRSGQCEFLYATPQHENNPLTVVFRLENTGEFITRVDIKIPEVIKLILYDRALTAAIKIAELEDHKY